MKTTVVNLRSEPYDVYIGRAGKGQDGYFGNPIRAGERCQECDEYHFFPGETINCYKSYLLRRIVKDPIFRKRLQELRGKRLGCFCKPNRCHGDIIVQFLEALNETV